MFVIRPIEYRDLDLLQQIAVESGPGFTSLPDNPDFLADKVRVSVETLRNPRAQPGPETYLFVLEDPESGEVAGTCGIASAVGLDTPFYHYHLSTVVHSSRELDVYNEFKTLNLCNDYTGSSELCTLYLRPQYRQSGVGTLLSKCRFLFIAEHPRRFNDRVIAEMRGFTDSHHTNPFWEGLGRHFFSMDYDKADYLTGAGNKVFIAELMPKHSIYIHLLPKDAQEVIGRVHPNTEAAYRMLEMEGFRFESYIDIFDAGPTLAARQGDIRAITQSRRLRISVQDQSAPEGSQRFLVANTRTTGFRCTTAQLKPNRGQVVLTPSLAQALHVSDGDQVRAVALSTPSGKTITHSSPPSG
ncbi:arginine N-succinyltransferase [Marinobacterium lacunae]|uniref:arginine N-succinyltransferase n=1 Tax=Marinobacterium lacunae TaxID=1232683 RepID=UPI00068BE6E8|nr:arginine N-succinyltransferase [Marinobacterium lacunae]MBR9884598.1 arginine N-succinyltransferase [Oceanospirillales bacterium]